MTCLVAGALCACSRPAANPAKTNESWDPKAAAAYLDQREVTWAGWIGAARDHDTFCIACHTAIPYALARPVLRKKLAENGLSLDGLSDNELSVNELSVNEHRLVDNVTKRVQLWSEIGPYYADEGYGRDKVARSRGTESVLNALILASYDAPTGRLSDATRTAFHSMWALQQTEGDEKGSWSWLQFGMEPFEAKDSPYYGACLAAVAVGMAPENYRSSPEIQDNLKMLQAYLDRKFETQSTINHVVLLWASTRLPGLVQPDRQKSIINEIWKEQRADGGWNLPSLVYARDWSFHSLIRKRWRSDGTLQATQSDGYATGLITFSLQQAGVAVSDPRLARGRSWLARNQDAEGFFPSVSVNVRRNPSSNIGHFMDDAATGFAVLALSGDVASGKHDVTARISQSANHQGPEKK